MLFFVIYGICFFAGSIICFDEDLESGLRLMGAVLVILAFMGFVLTDVYIFPMMKLGAICRHAGYAKTDLSDHGIVYCIAGAERSPYVDVLYVYEGYMKRDE